MPSVLCEELYQIFLRGEKAVPRELPLKLRQLSGFFLRHQATAASLEPIFTLERRLIVARGPHRQHLETQVFQTLFFSADAREAPPMPMQNGCGWSQGSLPVPSAARRASGINWH